MDLRENTQSHECVCLLTLHQPMMPTSENLQKLLDGTAPIGDLIEVREVKDKCHAKVNNPDQPFCTDCELAEHPQAHNQVGKRINLKETQ